MTTVEIAPHGPRPPIQVRPLPSVDPPYDDELEPPQWAAANQLALDWPTPGRTWQPPPTPAAERLARQVASARAAAGTAGDAKLAVRLFVQMFIEVLNGYRPAGHLVKLTVPKEASNVVAEAISGTTRVTDLRRAPTNTTTLRHRRPSPTRPRPPVPATTGPATSTRPRAAAKPTPGTSTGGHQRSGPPAPMRTPAASDGFVQRGGCTQPDASAQPRPDRSARGTAAMRQFPRRGAVDVLKFHFCEPRPGAVESTILLRTGERTWAMALRMELQGRRWMAAAVRLL